LATPRASQVVPELGSAVGRRPASASCP
jgi:hypothetical protein